MTEIPELSRDDRFVPTAKNISLMKSHPPEMWEGRMLDNLKNSLKDRKVIRSCIRATIFKREDPV